MLCIWWGSQKQPKLLGPRCVRTLSEATEKKMAKNGPIPHVLLAKKKCQKSMICVGTPSPTFPPRKVLGQRRLFLRAVLTFCWTLTLAFSPPKNSPERRLFTGGFLQHHCGMTSGTPGLPHALASKHFASCSRTSGVSIGVASEAGRASFPETKEGGNGFSLLEMRIFPPHVVKNDP